MKPRGTYHLRGAVWALVATDIAVGLLLAAAYLVVRSYQPNIAYHNPQWTWLLAFIPLVGVVQVLNVMQNNKRLARFADPALRTNAAPDTSTARMVVRAILLRIGMALLIIALVDPKAGFGKKDVTSTGMELMLCLDISTSMLAEDLKPNRLELAKRAMEQLIRNLTGDKVGVIVFAGDAYVQLPMTSDYEAAKSFVSGISTDLVSRQGTAIGAALELAAGSFDMGSPAEKAIVIMTDGENHEGNALEAARIVSEMGIAIHAVGVGSTAGAPIPVYRGGQRVAFKTDKEGNTVVTALNENMLAELVAVTEGIMVVSGSSDTGLGGLIKRIQNTEKTEMEAFTFSEYHHRFMWFAIPGALLLFFESLIRPRRQKWSSGLNPFDT